MNRAGGANAAAFTAADTVDTVWVFPNGDIQLADFSAGSALYILFCIDVIAVNGKAVKKTIYGA